MRFSLLSSVSFLFLAVAPMTAQAGFEFVPPPSAAQADRPAPAGQAAAATPAIVDNAPVTTENLEPTPYVDEKSTLPAAPIKENAGAPVAGVAVMPAPAPSDEPMVLGKKAVPLTPVVKDSDALVFDDTPGAMPKDVMSKDAMPKDTMARTPLASASSASAHDVLWDDKPTTDASASASTSAAPAEMMASDLPPVLPTEMPSDLAATPKIASSDIDDGLPVQGFGRQVPLALALQQIVPANYRYSFDTGVDPGQRVSWTGGKAWKAIITDLARNNGLNVDIVTNVVAFHRRTPMDIVSSSSDVDMSADTVQGMPLKPLPTDPMNDPVILPPIDSDAMYAPKTITEKRQAVAAEQVKTAEKRKANFDSMLDTDTPAQAMVKNKRILTSEDEPKVSEAETNSDLAAMNAAMTAPTSGSAKASVAKTPLAEETPATKQVAAKKIDVAPANDLVFDAPTATASADADIKADAGPMNIVPPSSGKPENVIASDLPLKDGKSSDMTGQDAFAAKALPTKDEWMKPLPTDEIAAAPAMSEKAASSVPPDLTTSREWEAFKNQTLRETLTAWSQTAGVSVVWSSEYDYPLQTDVRVSANYGDAVRTLLAGFSKAQPRPLGRLFKNDKVGAQPVLVVETQRLTN